MTKDKFTARFTTGGRLTSLEEWLTQNAKGTWSFKLEDVSEDMSKKNYLVVFSKQEDRDLFRQRFSIRKPRPVEPLAQAPSKTAAIAKDVLKSGAAVFKSVSASTKQFQAAIQKRFSAPAKPITPPTRAADTGISVTRSN